MSNLRNYKYLLIGFGKMGERYFNLLKEDGVEDIYIVEKKKERLNLIISKYDVSPNKIFKNINDIFFSNDNKKIVSLIATTADNRINFIRKLSKLKIKYIFCEKPMARSIKEAQDIKNLCKKEKINISINHSRRFSKETKKINDIVKNNKLGKLLSLNFTGANVGISMVAIHFIEAFLFMTQSKTTKIYGKLTKNKMTNPRGKKFKDYNGYIVVENTQKQKIIINTSEQAAHGCFVIYTYQKGMVVHDVIGEKIFINMRKKKYFKQPTYKYALPNKNMHIYFQNSKLSDITKIALKKLLINENFVGIESSLEALKIIIGAIQSSKINKEIKIKNINKNIKYEFA